MAIKVRAVADKRIFCLYAALNATVYHRENKKKMYPVRLRVREYLAKKNLDLDGLKQLFERYPQEFYYRFRDWALSHRDPPEFEEINDFWKRNDPKDLDKFEESLHNFWTQSNLEELWWELGDEYQAAVSEAQTNGEIAARRVERYLKMGELGIDELVVIPNLLENHNTGFGPKVGKSAYVILGPSQNGFSVSRIIHELLHSIINPPTKDYDIAKRSNLREYIIRAMVLRVNPDDASRQKLIDKEYPRIDEFLNKLQDFENSGKPFDEYLKTWLPAIKLD